MDCARERSSTVELRKGVRPLIPVQFRAFPFRHRNTQRSLVRHGGFDSRHSGEPESGAVAARRRTKRKGKMNFERFKTACKWVGMGFTDPDDHTKLDFVCHKKRPPGESWGICNEPHCPYFGRVGREVRIYTEDKLVATAESVRFVLE